MRLSDDQERARQAIHDAIADGQVELVLSGVAGSGKTTLMRTLLDDFLQKDDTVKLVAPTGKAAKRLENLTGHAASTIHQPLYAMVQDKNNDKNPKRSVYGSDLEFSSPRAVTGSVIICDEASMLGTRLYAELRRHIPHGSVLICVGDREQLPPVNDTWGPNFANPTAILTQVHRQAEPSRILQLATAIRTGEDWRAIAPSAYDYTIECASLAEVAEWASFERFSNTDVTLLGYTNAIRRRLSGMVRAARGFTTPLCVGDVLVCTMNNYKIRRMNGEVGEVAACEPVEGGGDILTRVKWKDGRRAAVVGPHTLTNGPSVEELAQMELQALFADQDADAHEVLQFGSTAKRVMVAEYGECLTVHKSQGSEWHTVGLVFDGGMEWSSERDPAFFRRLLYTAVTRASDRLTLFNVGASR